ncbi:MAG TPA: hypothetical protein VLH18_08775 [Candidatus Limnocylindrales bacterium]|nr:hypothetical protein [Candidatus Limnocylindrales bacterium]
MLSGKLQGEIGRIGAVAGWIVVVYLWIRFDLWYIFALYFIIHFLEAVTVGIAKGKAAGYSTIDSFLFTLLFGFTWWKYIYK